MRLYFSPGPGLEREGIEDVTSGLEIIEEHQKLWHTMMLLMHQFSDFGFMVRLLRREIRQTFKDLR